MYKVQSLIKLWYDMQRSDVFSKKKYAWKDCMKLDRF